MKRLIAISGWIFTIILGMCLIYTNNNNDSEVLNNAKINNIKESNFLTMMLETEAGSGEYALSNSGEWPGEGYTFNSELSKCENGGTLSWDSETNRVVMQSNKSDRCYVYFDKEPDITYLADYIKGLYTTDGGNDIYYHDGIGTYTNANLEAGDNSYRYAGADPNNYVCFGSDAATCPTDNLYRIIGVFGDEVKLIKADYAGESTLGTAQQGSTTTDGYYKGILSSIPTYYWSGSSSNNSNTWSSSSLNTSILNGTYITTLGSTWSNLIAEHTWQVGGMTYSNGYNSNAQTAYNYEVGNNTANTTYASKIGLMYVSDYYYSASPMYWSYVGYNSNSSDATSDYRAATSSNWIYMGAYEWTISRGSDTIRNAYMVYATGYIYDLDYSVSSLRGVRPSFYLASSVTYNGGSGSMTDPVRLNHG